MKDLLRLCKVAIIFVISVIFSFSGCNAEETKVPASSEEAKVPAPSVEAPKKSPIDNMDKTELLKKIEEDIKNADGEVLAMLPDLTRVKTEDGTESYALKVGDGPTTKLADLDEDTLRKFFARFIHARTIVQTQRIQRQLENNMRNIQNVQNIQRLQESQLQVQKVPQTVTAPPSQPPTPQQPPRIYTPPPAPPRQGR